LDLGVFCGARIFLGRVLTQVDDREDYGEVRVKAIGEADGSCQFRPDPT
jgi:hypothetical protein